MADLAISYSRSGCRLDDNPSPSQCFTLCHAPQFAFRSSRTKFSREKARLSTERMNRSVAVIIVSLALVLVVRSGEYSISTPNDTLKVHQKLSLSRNDYWWHGENAMLVCPRIEWWSFRAGSGWRMFVVRRGSSQLSASANCCRGFWTAVNWLLRFFYTLSFLLYSFLLSYFMFLVLQCCMYGDTKDYFVDINCLFFRFMFFIFIFFTLMFNIDVPEVYVVKYLSSFYNFC